MPDTFSCSSPEIEVFAKGFLAKHSKIVEDVLRESCRISVEAITQQTLNLIAQDEVAGCRADGTELGPASTPNPDAEVPGASDRNLSFVSPPAQNDATGLDSPYSDTSLTPLRNSFYESSPDAVVIGASASTSLPSAQSTAAGSNSPYTDKSLTPVCNGLHEPNTLRADPSPQTQKVLLVPAVAAESSDRKSAQPRDRIGSIVFGNETTGTLLKKNQLRESLRKSILGMSKCDSILAEQPAKGVYAQLADGEAMKKKLRIAITQPQYCVSDFYHSHGICQSIARSHICENITLFVIALNALWASIDVDHNDGGIVEEANPIFLVADNAFCLYFLGELLIRLGAFEVKRNSLKDRWFVFDAILLLAMIFDTWIFPLLVLLVSNESASNRTDGMANTTILKMLRSVRLIRLARVLKILNALPELMVVIKGLYVATRAVSCTVILMLLIIYVFAVSFRQICADTKLGDTFFTSVPYTKRYLLVVGTAPDLEDYVKIMWEEGTLYALMFLFFILVVSITIMNMLVGVLVSVVATVAKVEKEHMMVQFVRDNLQALMKVMHEEDENDDEKITKEEFRNLLQNKEAIRCFTAMGVDVIGLVDLGDFMFQDHAYLDFPYFLELIMQLRGSNAATVKDLVDLRRFITMEFNAVLHALEIIPRDTELCKEVSKTFTSLDLTKTQTSGFLTKTQTSGFFARGGIPESAIENAEEDGKKKKVKRKKKIPEATSSRQSTASTPSDL